jgi:hypothetical protein
MRHPLDDYLAVITGRGEARGFLEVRYRHGALMRSRFYPQHRLGALRRLVLKRGRQADVYVGCAIRWRERGDRQSVSESWTLWAEMDGPEARAALREFSPQPSLIIRSGTPGNVHAYWALAKPVGPNTLEDANRRLAVQLGADLVCCDAARILRPPGTFNFKWGARLPVSQLGDLQTKPFALGDVVDHLPSVPVPSLARGARGPVADELLAISPTEYVAVLTGQRVGRDGKVSCPFHTDRTPSLHAYPTPERGWYCFGCGRGGTIYDLAGALWQRNTRGPEFVELRRLLEERFC